MRDLPLPTKLIPCSVILAAVLALVPPQAQGLGVDAPGGLRDATLGHAACDGGHAGADLCAGITTTSRSTVRGTGIGAHRAPAAAPFVWSGDAFLTPETPLDLWAPRTTWTLSRKWLDTPIESASPARPLADVPPVLSTTFLLLAAILAYRLISGPHRRRKRKESRGRRTGSHKYIDDSVRLRDVARGMADSVTPQFLTRRRKRRRRSSRSSHRPA